MDVLQKTVTTTFYTFDDVNKVGDYSHFLTIPNWMAIKMRLHKSKLQYVTHKAKLNVRTLLWQYHEMLWDMQLMMLLDSSFGR